MSGGIEIDIQDSVWLITIDRPEKMNALDFGAHEELVETWLRFRDAEDARVAVLTGAGGKSFCAGADLKTYTMAFATTPPHEFRRRWVDGYGLGGITRGLDLDKPAISGSARRMPSSGCRTRNGGFTPVMADSSACRASSVTATPWR